ncbi:glycosyltransferase [Okibacterium fritillariae]|uniref:Predicted glycosyl transferase n=1 Tax=Okibacterium fritillariae TaxID=123320 RepID=A0A1T5KWB6_9MICO|nr:glycosyltransferase [Okibacterium fritillariae]SKC68007.1 Predicted glycosyl transferase [Okibacterium fritillariae]
MIGYYVHHHGSGHLSRATALARVLGDDLTGLSSLARPAGWTGDWLQLPADTGPDTDEPVDPTARGALHWVPRRAAGVRARAAALSAWFERARPRVIVTDVSVEVALLARLHGIPVVVVAQPGQRDDEAHRLAYRIADRVIGFWPAGFDVLQTAEPLGGRLATVGALSRFPAAGRTGDTASETAQAPVPVPVPGEILVFSGTGGTGPGALASVVRAARAALPERRFTELVDASAAQVEATLARASLVFSHCGQNAVAEIASARVPAVLVAEERPFAEQESLAAALAASDLPVEVMTPESAEIADWTALAARLGATDGGGWEAWVDGAAAERAAQVIRDVAEDRS